MADENKMQEQGTEQGANGEEITMESLMAELAKAKAENAKNKTALDKALHNNGELTKQLRAKMTASEQEEQAKKEAADALMAEMQELKAFKRRAEAQERYTTIGMSAEFAKAAADAEVKGDMDAFAAIMKRYNEATIKAQQDEWNRNRPDINAGHETSEDETTKLEKEIATAMGLA